MWTDAGNPRAFVWAVTNDMHRVDGPARCRWNDAGELIFEEWRLNGCAMTTEEIEHILQPEAYMAVLRMLPQPIYEEIAAVFRAV